MWQEHRGVRTRQQSEHREQFWHTVTVGHVGNRGESTLKKSSPCQESRVRRRVRWQFGPDPGRGAGDPGHELVDVVFEDAARAGAGAVAAAGAAGGRGLALNESKRLTRPDQSWQHSSAPAGGNRAQHGIVEHQSTSDEHGHQVTGSIGDRAHGGQPCRKSYSRRALSPPAALSTCTMKSTLGRAAESWGRASPLSGSVWRHWEVVMYMRGGCGLSWRSRCSAGVGPAFEGRRRYKDWQSERARESKRRRGTCGARDPF